MRRRPGLRVKLALLLAVVAPGLLADVLTARANIASQGPQSVDIGRPHQLIVSGYAYVQCHASGCEGSVRKPLDLLEWNLELDVELEFKPDDASRPYTLNVRANGGHRFVPPLTGQLTFVRGTLSEKAKRDIVAGASERCDEFEIEERIDVKKFTVTRLGDNR